MGRLLLTRFTVPAKEREKQQKIKAKKRYVRFISFDDYMPNPSIDQFPANVMIINETKELN
jgi:hypothetical protein